MKSIRECFNREYLREYNAAVLVAHVSISIVVPIIYGLLAIQYGLILFAFSAMYGMFFLFFGIVPLMIFWVLGLVLYSNNVRNIFAWILCGLIYGASVLSPREAFGIPIAFFLVIGALTGAIVGYRIVYKKSSTTV
jgi:hypothetical protein